MTPPIDAPLGTCDTSFHRGEHQRRYNVGGESHGCRDWLPVDAPREEPKMDEATKQMQDRLYATDEAAVWAEEWAKTARGILDREGCNPEALATLPAPVNYAIDALLDEGWMIGWFANAIETAKDIQARGPRG